MAALNQSIGVSLAIPGLIGIGLPVLPTVPFLLGRTRPPQPFLPVRNHPLVRPVMGRRR